jgi:mRNA-degrading endonuclease RelE of RelBE toxin-antitoxin system
MWRLKWTSKAKRQFRGLADARKAMVLELLEELQYEPEQPLAEPLEPSCELAGYYKLKFNGWRVIYRPKPLGGEILILAIAPRSGTTYVTFE